MQQIWKKQSKPHIKNDGLLASGRTSAVGGAALDAQDERVALRRARVPAQHVLQHRDELVAVAGHHARVVDGWHAPTHASQCTVRTMTCTVDHHALSGWLAGGP